MPSRIDEAGHTKAVGYQVAEHWGESRNVQFRRWDSNRQHRQHPESNVLQRIRQRNCVLADFVQIFSLMKVSVKLNRFSNIT